MENGQIKRMEYVDVAKGIGIVSMLVGHHIQGAELLVKWIYSFHMPLFFLLTGYLYETRKRRAEVGAALFRKQAERLLYPYLTFSVLMLLWKFVFHVVCGVPYTNGEDPFGVMVLNALTTNGVHALWFLPAMFWASTAYLILSSREHPVWLLPVLSILAAIILSKLTHLPVIHESAFFRPVNYAARAVLGLSFICLGACYAKRDLSGVRLMLIALFASVLFGLLNEDVSMFGSYIGNPVYYYLAALGGCVFILCLSKRISGFARLMSFLGKNSLIVMATDLSFPDEIAWMILGVTRINRILPPIAVSCVMILVQIVLVAMLICFIQRFAKWMIKVPKRSVC